MLTGLGVIGAGGLLLFVDAEVGGAILFVGFLLFVGGPIATSIRVTSRWRREHPPGESATSTQNWYRVMFENSSSRDG